MESDKNWNSVESVIQVAMDYDLPRNGTIIGIGGGVVLDVAGFAASIYRRGINYIRIPTSLIGIVDVGVGIKHGINHAGKKNIIGSFYPPLANINDIRLIATQPHAAIISGMAEIIKLGMVFDVSILEKLEQYGSKLAQSRFQEPIVVAQSVVLQSEQIMINELRNDLFESDLRRAVNFGHTFSPVLESISGFRIPHGEAVATDMLLSTAIAVLIGTCPASDLTRLSMLYKHIEMPLHLDLCTVQSLSKAIEEARSHRAGALNMVVPNPIGQSSFIDSVSEQTLNDALKLSRYAIAEAVIK